MVSSEGWCLGRPSSLSGCGGSKRKREGVRLRLRGSWGIQGQNKSAAFSVPFQFFRNRLPYLNFVYF